MPGLGPNGEVPVIGITDEEVAAYAQRKGISFEDARFVLFEGGAALVQFNMSNLGNEEYGSVRPLAINGELRIQLRVTVADSALPDSLSRMLGREVDVLVAGQSFAQNQRDMESIARLLVSQGLPRAHYAVDFEQGLVVLRIHPDEVRLVQGALPETVIVQEDPTVEAPRPASYAGAPIDPGGCTLGYTLKNGSGPEFAVATAAHCPNDGQTAFGYSLSSPIYEQCSGVDFQLHLTEAPSVWWGFYNYDGVWTGIYEFAGGFYEDQPFFRRGRHTIAEGEISNIKTLTNGPLNECTTAYTYQGFELYNDRGNGVVAGDSGGPLLLAYAGFWFMGGVTSGQAVSGVDGSASWTPVVAGWITCSQQTPC